MRRTALLLLLLSLAGTLACTRPDDGSHGGETVFRHRLMDDPPDMDPARARDVLSDTVLLKMFDGLVDLDPATLEIVPAVAESWEISEDGLVYTFHLRPDVKFHNEREVIAADAVYTFTRALRPETRSGRPWVFTPILGAEDFADGKAETVEGLEAVDDRTLRITLERPFAPFLAHLAVAQGGLVPREIYDDRSRSYLRHPVGCGPFRFGSWTPGQSITLEAFPDYYGEGPFIDRLVFYIIDSQETALQEYRAGNLDLTDEIPSGKRAALMEEFGSQYRRWPQLQIRFFILNHARPPFQGNRALRQAMNHALDRKFLLEELGEGKDFPVPGILPPGLPAFDPERRGYDFDPDKARRLLVEAGYPNGEGLPELSLLYPTNEGHRRMGERVVADLAAVGVKVRLRNLDFGAYLAAITGTLEEPPEDEILSFGWVADYPDAFNFLFPNLHSSNLGPGGNYSHYVNPEFDALLDEAIRETDTERRIELYRRAETLAVEDAVWLFFYSYRDEALVRPEVQGLILNPLGDFAFPISRVRLTR